MRLPTARADVASLPVKNLSHHSAARTITLIAVAPFEMFFYDRPFARKFLHIDTTNIDDARLWAFCIGARNLFAATGTMNSSKIIRAAGGDDCA